MKSYPDFSLNAQIEHRNFDISFLGFKKRFKIEPIRVLSDLPKITGPENHGRVAVGMV